MSCVLEIAELSHCLDARRVGRETEAAQLVDAHIEMESQLVVDIVADLTARPPRKAKQSPRHRLRRFEHLEHGLGVASPG